MITILVVDDDPSIRFLLRQILEHERYTILEAGNGQAALDAIGSGAHPDIVMTDLMMPVMSGADLIVRLRADPKTSNVPILVVSGNPEAIKDLAVDAVVRKPFVAADLAARVRTIVSRADLPHASPERYEKT